jgi:hypothetical protein
MKDRKTLTIVMYTICTLILIWFIVSWVDVMKHNAVGDESYQYWVFNLFRIFEGRVQ